MSLNFLFLMINVKATVDVFHILLNVWSISLDVFVNIIPNFSYCHQFNVQAYISWSNHVIVFFF
jgi:hypothetical protein